MKKEEIEIKYDFDKLRGLIREKLKSESNFAKKIGISAASLSAKFNNKTDFTAEEISKSCEEDVLDIKLEEIGPLFFTQKLELNSRKTI